ncbi:MAG: Spy/CpxP family protein refolding chaperone [Syntrophorhabdales bacterium]|jgi:zinc resistance-associated protein
MSRWFFIIFLSLLLLPYAMPVYAQVGDVDDEAAVMLVADMASQDQPADPGPAMEGQMGHEGHSMPMMGQKGHEEHKGHWAGFLNLSEDQKAKTKDIHTRFYAETRGLRYDLMEKRIELRRLFLDPKTDAAAVMAKEREVSALRQKLGDATARMMIDWRGVLTPEQLQKLDMMSLAHHEGMGAMGMPGHMGMMQGRMGMMQGRMGSSGCMGMHEGGMR